MRGSHMNLFKRTLTALSAIRWSTTLAFSSRRRGIPGHRRSSSSTSPRFSRVALLSSSSTSTSQPEPLTTTSSTPSSSSYEKLCLGGDFAGLMAKFSPTDGDLIPIPEHLVPESLLEWGQEPSALEVLTSEEWQQQQDAILARQEITILPDVGCGIDNLETTKSETIFEEKTMKNEDTTTASCIQPSESTLMLDTTTTTTRSSTIDHRLETQFALPGMTDHHRIRVSVDLQVLPQEKQSAADDGNANKAKKMTSYQIQSPIILFLEHQTSTTSSQGTRADGGGLDGRTVSQLMGEWLRKSQSFAEKKYDSPGDWIHKQKEVQAPDQQDAEDLFTASSVIRLPANITISSGPATTSDAGAWILELSHYAKEQGSRRIVQRKFTNTGLECEAVYKEELGEYIK